MLERPKNGEWILVKKAPAFPSDIAGAIVAKTVELDNNVSAHLIVKQATIDDLVGELRHKFATLDGDTLDDRNRTLNCFVLMMGVEKFNEIDLSDPENRRVTEAFVEAVKEVFK